MRLRIEGEKKLVDVYFIIEPGFIRAEFASQKNTVEQLIREALISHANNKLGTTIVRFADKSFDVESRFDFENLQ